MWCREMVGVEMEGAVAEIEALVVEKKVVVVKVEVVAVKTEVVVVPMEVFEVVERLVVSVTTKEKGEILKKVDCALLRCSRV